MVPLKADRSGEVRECFIPESDATTMTRHCSPAIFFQPDEIRSAALTAIREIKGQHDGRLVQEILVSEPIRSHLPEIGIVYEEANLVAKLEATLEATLEANLEVNLEAILEAILEATLKILQATLEANLDKVLQFIQLYTKDRVEYNSRFDEPIECWMVLQTRDCLRYRIQGALSVETAERIVRGLKVVPWYEERQEHDEFCEQVEKLESGRLALVRSKAKDMQCS